MVGRRRSHRRRLAASHSRSWLWGRHAVVELLEAGRWQPLELRVAERMERELKERVTARAKALDVPWSEHPFEKLTDWCGTTEHQGLLALMPPYPYADLEAVLAASRPPALFLLLDRIQDPHNFGAILRSAEVFRVDGVIVGGREQCEVTPHVARSSAGGVNYLSICRVEDLATALQRLSAVPDLDVAAATTDGAQLASEHDFRRPTILVLGSEGSGLDPRLLTFCRTTVRIPQGGRIGSLNVAVAAGVLLYEIRRQRGFAE